ncbi:rod shape-determining protein MreC [Candidatus Babeliales bacterium]|nr:rod shape-determining protein MreC [Candidatus Babeliales bacterium]
MKKIKKGSSFKGIGTALLLSVTLIFFVVHHFFIKSPGSIEQVASYVLYPVLVVQKQIVSSFKHYRLRMQDTEDVYAKFLEISEKNESLKSRITELEASHEFFEQTKELIEFQKKYDMKCACLSQIIFKRLSEHEQIIMVDKGSYHGITKDMVAVNANNLLGKVIDVYPYYSTVMLVTDKRCNVSVYCAFMKTKGILQGANSSDRMFLTHVDRLQEVQKKDLLISSGEGTVFPQGFKLGTIESFIPDGVHYKVIVTPSCVVDELDYCYLLQKGAERSL